MTEEVKVSGLKELRESLLKLPEKIQGKALQGALAEAAKPIVAVARAMAPERTGKLKKAIFSFRNRDSRRQYESRLISVRKKAFYWKFVELGHGVIQTDKRSLGNEKKGFFGPVVSAVPARPFLRPAFEATKYIALNKFKESLWPQIVKAAGRAARRSYNSASFLRY